MESHGMLTTQNSTNLAEHVKFGEVFHEWLDTLYEGNSKNKQQKQYPSLKTMAAVYKQKNYKPTRAATFLLSLLKQ